MGQVAVIAKMTAKEGKRDEVIKVFQALIEAVKDEPGTLVYAINVSATSPDEVWFYELYRDNDALMAHGGSEAMKRASGPLGELLAGRAELFFLEPVTAKGLAT